MKFSACTAAFGMADLKKIIDTSAKLGYDAVELTAALHLPVESTPERRKEVLGWIHDAGIVCSALHYIFDGTIRLLSTDSEMMNQSAAYLKQVVDVAYDMECPTVIVGSGGKTRSFEPDWDRNLPNVRTMADTYHLNIEEVNPAETIRKYGHTLANLHLADSNRQAPGDGHFDFASVAEALREVDFKRYCSFEVFGLYPWKLWYDTFEESVEHMGNGIKYARSIFG